MYSYFIFKTLSLAVLVTDFCNVFSRSAATLFCCFMDIPLNSLAEISRFPLGRVFAEFFFAHLF